MRGETSETLGMGGGHAHCGTLVYLGDNFPERFRNTVFMCNVHGRRINHDLLRRKGSGYTASHGKDLMISGDPWFMGVTLRTGPDGSVHVSDWSDTGECHTYKPRTTTGRIYKITYGKPGAVRVDLTRISDDELVRLHLHKNDWHVRHARRLLQERARERNWNAEPVHLALRKMLASHPEVTRRLRALWTLHATGGVNARHLFGLLQDPDEHVRAWAIQLLCEGGSPAEETLRRLSAMAYDDPSPVVRLYLACALQRLAPADRWPIANGLLSHLEDADDANLPLMYWYGIEPLVPEDPAKAVRLGVQSRLPLVSRFLARRLIDAQTEKQNNLDPLVEALGKEGDSVCRELLDGVREGVRGRKDLATPAGWPAVYARLRQSEDPVVRDHAIVVALAFNDPRAIDDLRQTAESKTTPTERRHSALSALIDRRTPGLAPRLHNLLDDEAMRPLALRGLAAYDHAATPQLVLALYPKLTTAEKQDALATLASRKGYVLALLDAIEGKVVPPGDISAYLARQLYLMNDKTITERLRKVWGDVRERAPEKQEQIARYKKLLTPSFMNKADLANGKLIYSKTCQQCHLLHGEGGKIGPDLTGSNRGNLDYLLANMVDPSAEIGRDYRMSLVETKDGRVLTGIFIERTPNRMILQTATDQHILAPGEVDSLTDSSLSMMPEGQLEMLTREQVRDLIAYLGSPKAP
jgi:putative heme-binding domain-containing protein